MIEYENLHLSNQSLFTKYKDNFETFIESGWFILGNQVKKFEEEFATYCGTRYCIGVASGLDALILAIDALKLPRGSEIIVPSNTYIATILAIVRTGCKPILVEPDIATYTIDTSKIEEKISPRTKAILIVHLYGKMCDMEAIMNIAHKNNLQIIEDVAQAHGARYKDKIAGSFGIGCFSFYPTKNLGALGDAGAITTDDENLNAAFRLLRNYGSAVKYYNEEVGYNSRLDELQAGFLSIKLALLDEINRHKRMLAHLYLDNISDDFIKPVVHENYFDVYHIFNIRHKKRDALKTYLMKNDIKTEIHYPLSPHRQKAMQGIVEGEYPISDEIHKTTLSLPISYFHTAQDVLHVCEVVNKALNAI